METNESENTTVQKSLGCSKSCIAIQAYLKKKEKSQINNLTLHLKELEKEEQTKPKTVEGNNKDQRKINEKKKKLIQLNSKKTKQNKTKKHTHKESK